MAPLFPQLRDAHVVVRAWSCGSRPAAPGAPLSSNPSLQEDLISSTSSSRPKKLFTITSDRNTREVHGRHAAIKAAKTMSRRTWRPVHVEREDQKVQMKYHRGSLQDFRMDPRKRRS
jgi:hypothetical protein